MSSKKINLKDCLNIVKKIKKRKKKVVMTNGCFDIIHSGHIDYLKKSKSFGDILIIAINADLSVRKLKGKSRPINNLKNRIKVLSAISYIDFIIPFNHQTPENSYKKILPNILTKGSQYKKKVVSGASHVIKNGGKVKFIKMVAGQSTSNIINKISRL